jgi:hypothetical protein
MQRWPSTVTKAFTTLMASVLASCVNAPVQPVGLGFPAPNRPQMLAPVFDSTRHLDCLSAELHNAGADKEKLSIFLTAMPNTAGPKVGKIDLPPSLQPFVRASFDRISSGIRVLSEEDQVQMRMTGGLYTMSPYRVLDNELEALGFGLGSRVEAADIGIQLYWDARVPKIKSKVFEQSGTGVTVNLRLYSAEQGASAFVITSTGSNGLVLGRSRATQEASPHLAIQSAVNVAVAMLVKARAAREWGVASSCDLGESGRIAIPGETNSEPFKPAVDVRLVLSKGNLCAQVKPRHWFPQVDDPLVLEVSEFRGEGIEIRRSTINVAPLRQIAVSNQSVCLPQGAFDARTEEVRYWFKSFNGQRLGGAQYFLQ